MSPAPARTSDQAIVAAARDLLEAGGLDAVTMQAVAASVGVRAPSLYKHVASRSALLRAVAEDAMAEIGAELTAAARTGDPTADVRSMAAAFRAWARHSPNAYRHLFGPSPDERRPSTGLGATAVAPLLDACAQLVGPVRALDAARLLTAYVHGFTNMELAGAFGLGGDIDGAFSWGVETLARALRDAEPQLPVPESLVPQRSPPRESLGPERSPGREPSPGPGLPPAPELRHAPVLSVAPEPTPALEPALAPESSPVVAPSPAEAPKASSPAESR